MKIFFRWAAAGYYCHVDVAALLSAMCGSFSLGGIGFTSPSSASRFASPIQRGPPKSNESPARWLLALACCVNHELNNYLALLTIHNIKSETSLEQWHEAGLNPDWLVTSELYGRSFYLEAVHDQVLTYPHTEELCTDSKLYINSPLPDSLIALKFRRSLLSLSIFYRYVGRSSEFVYCTLYRAPTAPDFFALTSIMSKSHMQELTSTFIRLSLSLMNS